MDTYEKKYNEALSQARFYYGNCPTEPEKKKLENIFPELRESEDEKTRKRLIDFISNIKRISESGRSSWAVRNDDAEMCDTFLVWLEKQKENPKSADSISSDCTSDANSKDRWHKTANSLPDNGRDVLAKDALGNYHLASFDGAQWFVSVYDGEDHPVIHTPPILEWCDIPSEKQKEQKPAEWSEEDEKIRQSIIKDIEFERNYTSATTDKADNVIGRYNEKLAWIKSLPERFNLQPKNEWSKEDEFFRQQLIVYCEKCVQDTLAAKCVNWLKSLRPQPHWKPSKEQIDAVRYFVNKHQSEAWAATGQWKKFTALRGLLGDLLKQM